MLLRIYIVLIFYLKIADSDVSDTTNPKRALIHHIIHSYDCRGYHKFANLRYGKHFRVHHRKNEFVRGRSHINGIESFLELC